MDARDSDCSILIRRVAINRVSDFCFAKISLSRAEAVPFGDFNIVHTFFDVARVQTLQPCRADDSVVVTRGLLLCINLSSDI